MNKNRFILVAFVCFVMILSNKIFAQADSIKIYNLEEISIVAKKIDLLKNSANLSKDRLANIFEKNGYSLIRKGVFFANDIYVDGFKRGNVSIIVDNERYHSAGPNRMDSPLTRINPLEMGSVKLIKSNYNIQSKLGGLISYKRIPPPEDLLVKVSLSGMLASSKKGDFALRIGAKKQAINFRFAKGLPYLDAKGRDFKTLYNYKQIKDYLLSEISFHGIRNDFKYGISFTYSEDVSFPYLQMDERKNQVYSGFLSYKNNKIYFNYTNHEMDNGFRNSMQLMDTKAKNLTVGIVGKNYEVYYRNWDVTNKMQMANMNISNHMIPNAESIYAALSGEYRFNHLLLNWKLGINRKKMRDAQPENLISKYYEGSEFNRYFPIFGVTASLDKYYKSGMGYGLIGEISSESPEMKFLFINLKRALSSPDWIGNPNISQPLKIGLRGILDFKGISLELYFNEIYNYVNLTNRNFTKQILTYENVHARIMGINVSYNSIFVDLNLYYTYGQNINRNSPLSEIRPLTLLSELRSPKYNNIQLLGKIFASLKQSRVDKLLNETATEGWYRVDLGISYESSKVRINVIAENITNQLFTKHLSYLRDPFTTNLKVYEPGREFFFELVTSF